MSINEHFNIYSQVTLLEPPMSPVLIEAKPELSCGLKITGTIILECKQNLFQQKVLKIFRM